METPTLPNDLPTTLPVLPLRRGFILPSSAKPFLVGRKQSLAALEAAHDGWLLIALQRDATSSPSPSDLLSTAVLAKVIEKRAAPHGRGSCDYLWIAEDDALAVIDAVAADFPVDPDRVYVQGISQTGYWTWWLAQYAPDRWAAAAPVGAVTTATGAVSAPATVAAMAHRVRSPKLTRLSARARNNCAC